MKKNIAIVLLMALVIQIIPVESYALGTMIKSLDVETDIDNMTVNHRAINHKEIISYDNEVYVPLMDLATGLDLKVNFNGEDTIWINSESKLDLDGNSMAYIAYQRGYEIDAKTRIISEIEAELQGIRKSKIEKGQKKNIKVGFQNINVYLDNRLLELTPEPIIYNNDVYVSMASISRELLITPKIRKNTLDFDTNAVLRNQDIGMTVEQLASSRELANGILDMRLEEMNKMRKIILEMKLPYMNIKNTKDMELYLNKYFNTINIDEKTKVVFDIKLEETMNSNFYINMTINSKYSKNWRKLTKGQVQGLVWDQFAAITELYNENASLEGSIREKSYSSAYVTFQSEYKNLDFNFTNSRLELNDKVDTNYILDLLYKNRSSIYRYSNFEFEARISGYDIEFNIKDTGSLYTSSWDAQRKAWFLNDLKKVIEREYPDHHVFGRIYDESRSLNFSLDGDISSPEITKELVDMLNDKYGYIRVDGTSIKISYGIVEEDNEIRLSAYADISKTSNVWSENIKSEIQREVDRALREVLKLYSRDIIVNIYDSNGLLIDDYGIYRNRVAKVRAVPASGEILSDERITLSTDTRGGTIYYSLDGSNPTTKSIKYEGPFVLGNSATIKAFAVKDKMKDSEISEFKYVVVDDKNAAKGLDSLEITPGSLSPKFTSKTRNYELKIDENTEKITVIARESAGGTIFIGGQIVKSGEAVEIPIPDHMKNLEIKHREDGKKDIIYTINFNRTGEAEDGEIEIDIEIFKTTPIVIVKGKLRGDASDFSKYSGKVVLKSGSDIIGHEPFDIESDGSFKTTFDSDTINNIIGYRLEIYDGQKLIKAVDLGN